MKTTGARSLILYILAFGFLFGLGFFLVSLQADGGKWALQPYNRHLSAGGSLSYAGRVLDRNGVVLAQSGSGERLYAEDELVRRATLHVVGDTHGYISTGVQYMYRSELSGYNMITGLATPTGKSTGNDIRLTLDSGLCRLALQKFGNHKGAAALYNYKTGEILCMVSTPGFDPGNVPGDINTDTSGKYEGAYLNRAISSSYTPGSIFKIITAAAALENLPGVENRVFTCAGSTTINGERINCLGTHGRINLADGMAKSCNVVFAELAVELGGEAMTREAEKMGFNTRLTLDGIPISESRYDVAAADENGLAWSGIGQYTDLTNPYHMMLLMGSIANGGTPASPYLIAEIKTHFGLPVRTGRTRSGRALAEPATAESLKTLLRHNVTSEYGDGLFPGLSACAKTGTAEVGKGKRPNGWMVGFSADEATPFAFAVVVEEADSGMGSAGKIASALMREAAK